MDPYSRPLLPSNEPPAVLGGPGAAPSGDFSHSDTTPGLESYERCRDSPVIYHDRYGRLPGPSDLHGEI